MATVVSATDIPPGGEGRIQVKVSTGGRRGDLQKTIVVQSNDPAQPHYTLKIHGKVEVLAAFDPDRLNLQNVAKGETITQTVKLVGRDVEKLKISELVSSNPEELSAEMIEEEGKPAVKISYKSGEKSGRISARVTAKTNLDNPKEMLLHVYGQISDDLVAERPYVLFPGLPGQESGSILAQAASVMSAPLAPVSQPVRLKVSSLTGKPFNITGVEDPEGNVFGTAKQENEEWQVYLLLAKKPKTPRGLVRILTDREDQPAIEVRYNSRTSIQPPPPRPHPGMLQRQPGRLSPTITPKKDMPSLRPLPAEQKGRPLQIKSRKPVVPIRKLPERPEK